MENKEKELEHSILEMSQLANAEWGELNRSLGLGVIGYFNVNKLKKAQKQIQYFQQDHILQTLNGCIQNLLDWLKKEKQKNETQKNLNL